MREPVSRDTIGNINQNICVYGDYVHVSTNGADAGANNFEKNVYFPTGFFADNIMPVCLYSLEYRGDAVHRILPVLGESNHNRGRIRADSQLADFDENQDYFANVIAFGVNSTVPDGNTFMPINWGTEDEDLQVSSEALNQMAGNDDYLVHNKVTSTLSNVDYVTDDRDYFVRYLNDNIILYGKYDEFSPLQSEGFNKNDDAESDHPKKITRTFEFPDNLFKNNIHPVVVANVGAKIAANDNNSDAIRKISCILKDVKRKGFTLEIWEMSEAQEFASGDVYFVSYLAMGERPGDV